MKLGCLPWLFAIGLLWGGGQATFTGFTNRKKTEVTVEELYQKIPDGKWIKVTGGRLNLLDSAYTSFFGADASSLYIPIVPSAESEEGTDAPIRLLLHTKNKVYLDRMNELGALEDEEVSELEILEKLASMQEELFPIEDVEGLVQFGIDDGKEEGKVRDLFENLHPDCLVIEDGERPSMGAGLLMLFLGALLTAFLSRGSLKKNAATNAGVPPPTA